MCKTKFAKKCNNRQVCIENKNEIILFEKENAEKGVENYEIIKNLKPIISFCYLNWNLLCTLHYIPNSIYLVFVLDYFIISHTLLQITKIYNWSIFFIVRNKVGRILHTIPNSKNLYLVFVFYYVSAENIQEGGLIV